MSRRVMRKMSQDGGLILGAMGSGPRSELVSYPLEGAAMTVALPRTGKTALIAGNLLSPKGLGLCRGSVIVLDPRGEIYCVVAKRRREMERNVVLVDPFRVVANHVEEFGEVLKVPCVDTVQFNPLDFVRRSSKGVADIRALLDGLLTPPKGGADNSRHFYESARAMLGGMMAWCRCMQCDPERRAVAFRTVREFMMATGDMEKNMKNAILGDPSLGWGLPFDAMQRMEKVGIAEGGEQLLDDVESARLVADAGARGVDQGVELRSDGARGREDGPFCGGAGEPGGWRAVVAQAVDCDREHGRGAQG